ncbi:MAG: type IV pilus twitching motility protein PilT [Bacillota bacterium]
MEINQLLKAAVEQGASDLHLTVNLAPVLRIDGRLLPLQMPPLQEDDVVRLVNAVLSRDKLNIFEERGEVDLSYELPESGYFRINVYRQRGSIGAAFRVIRTSVATLADLGLPDSVAALARRQRGLILVTGPAGSGKSATLAAMTDLINREREYHVITLEDPIEYLHRHNRSMITQREIGRDSKSFPAALRAALRQDPDVIMVGEMRDLETISIAVTAAETGHLVMATLHTSSAAQTVERIIDIFPHNRQDQIRVQLASSLAGVISQRLLQRKEGPGRVPAVEVLTCTPAVRNLIRDGKIHQINSYMQTGARHGMQTMDKHLQILVDQGIISSEEALEHCLDKDNMLAYLKNNIAPPNYAANGPLQMRMPGA